MEETNTKREKSGPRARIIAKVPQKSFGIRTSALMEMVLFLAILTILNHVFGDGHRFINLSPHPFWIIVILIAVQYGTNEALLSAALSTLILLFKNLPVQAIDETMFDYVFKVSFTPLLWIITSVVIGELRVRHIKQVQQLTADLSDVREREATITKAYEQLRIVKEGLETRIAGQLKGTTASYQSLKSIESLNPVQILTGVGEIVENVINPEKFSVFTFGTNGFEVIDSTGWTESDGYSRRITSESPIYQELTNKRRVICAINKTDAELLGKEGLLAGPLINPQTDQIFGMLKVEYLDFIELTVTNVETFKILCEWAGSAYAQAKQYRETQADAMHNQETGTLSRLFAEFVQKMFEQMERRDNVVTSVLNVKLTIRGRTKTASRVAAARRFCQMLQTALPKSAVICDGRRKNTQYVVYLPGTSMDKAKALVNDLESWKEATISALPEEIEVEITPGPIT